MSHNGFTVTVTEHDSFRLELILKFIVLKHVENRSKNIASDLPPQYPQAGEMSLLNHCRPTFIKTNEVQVNIVLQ